MPRPANDDEWVDVSKGEDESAAYNTYIDDRTHLSPVYAAGDLRYVLRVPKGAIVNEAKRVANALHGCNACIHRAGIYVRDIGPSGPVFLHNLTCGIAAPCAEVTKLRELAEDLAEQACQSCQQHELVVVTDATYAPVREGKCAATGEEYGHWTVHPAACSTSEAATRYSKLARYYGQMDVRLAKLTVPEALASVNIMLEEQPHLERPEHYAACLRWVKTLQRLAVEQCTTGSGAFELMSLADKAKLRVLAILHGRVEGATHLDFHQSDNIVDFLTLPSRDALRAEMDSRSDPRFYMVSQLNRKLASAGVTSRHLIGLTWDGKFTDDLDIHVKTPSGNKVYYGNKSADGCTLDFDANVTQGEANPCENVSCKPGTFEVSVDNYTRRTRGAVPFQVVCRQEGMPDVVYDGTWPANRAKGRLLLVCRHTFTEAREEPGGLAMSAGAAGRAKALAGEWSAKIGEPTAVVATTDDLAGACGATVYRCGRGATRATEPAQVGRVFMSMAASTSNKTAPAADPVRRKKAFLSESVKRHPTTVSELVAHVQAHPATQLAVRARDHAPGYMVSLATKCAGVRKTDLPAPCHFHDKHALPVKPVRATVGNARLDRSWLPCMSPNGYVRVSAVVDVAGSCPFLALEGAALPTCGEAFPLASGFYPTDLSADYHVHRERWAFYHSQLKPRVPTDAKEGAVTLVGAFLTGDKAIVYMDGVQLMLKT